MLVPIFDVFYLHKYSHGFSNFNDIIIQFFRKSSVMTVATLDGGRTVHIYTATNVNGTIGWEVDSIWHIGQGWPTPFHGGGIGTHIYFHTVFFEESWIKLVVAMAPYNQEVMMRTTNNENSIVATENTVCDIHYYLIVINDSMICLQARYKVTAQLFTLGDQLGHELLGYVALGVDPSASYMFRCMGYLHRGGLI